MKRGFTLLELSMVLVISSLMVGFALKATSTTATADCYAVTRTQLAAIKIAMDQFVRKNDRYPMPAQRNIGVTNPQYGREAVIGNLTPAPTVSPTSVWGALPFQALGLNTSFAGDCWGNKFTYVVTTAQTSPAASGGYLDPAVNGAVTVKSNASNNFGAPISYAVISHGADGLGAVPLNYSGATMNWCNPMTPQIKHTNCLPTTATVMNAPFNNGDTVNYFDDLLIAAAGKPIAGTTNTCPFCNIIPLL